MEPANDDDIWVLLAYGPGMAKEPQEKQYGTVYEVETDKWVIAQWLYRGLKAFGVNGIKYIDNKIMTMTCDIEHILHVDNTVKP